MIAQIKDFVKVMVNANVILVMQDNCVIYMFYVQWIAQVKNEEYVNIMEYVNATKLYIKEKLVKLKLIIKNYNVKIIVLIEELVISRLEFVFVKKDMEVLIVVLMNKLK